SHFALFGETADGVQRKHHPAPRPHFERASRRRHQRNPRQLRAVLGHQLLGHLRGQRGVAARAAVLDLHFQLRAGHANSPPLTTPTCFSSFYPFVEVASRSRRRGQDGRAPPPNVVRKRIVET